MPGTALKWVLPAAAIAEAATGVALVIVPALVGQLLLGAELAGAAIPVARVAGIALIALGIACWPGPPPRHVDLQRTGHAVSGLPGLHQYFDRRLTMVGGRPSRDPDRILSARLHAKGNVI